MRCCARLSRAPATILSARVIFCVDLTLTMRDRIAFSEGTSVVRLSRRRAVLTERLPILLESAAKLGLEPFRGLAGFGDGELFLRAKCLEDLRMPRVEERVEALLVRRQLRHVESVHEAHRRCIDDDDLLLCRQRDVLALLQDLHEP